MSTALASVTEKSDRTDRPRREPWLDNAKMLLVTLVVVGHTLGILPTSTATQWLYDYIYLFHMPAFVLVTGYLSRSFVWSRQSLVRLVTGVAVPYFLFEAALAVYREQLSTVTIEDLWVDPHYPMWFLAALFLWRLSTPVIRSIPYVVPLALVACLAAGLHHVEMLDIGRVLGFLPFYVVGVVARPEHVAWVRSRAARRLAVPALVAAVPAAWLMQRHMDYRWFYWQQDYASLGVSPMAGAAGRLVLFGACLTMALAVLALVPQRRTWFTAMGASSLVVYLFHGFAVKGARYAGLPDLGAGHPLLALVVGVAAALVVALVLAAPPVATRLAVLADPLNPRWWRRFRRERRATRD